MGSARARLPDGIAKKGEHLMSDVIYLGIDLGSSRTSITASTGARETVWSYVGYAQDHVARKKLGGRGLVYGKEAEEGRKQGEPAGEGGERYRDDGAEWEGQGWEGRG